MEGVCFVDESISHNLVTTVSQATVPAGRLEFASLWKPQNSSETHHELESTTQFLRGPYLSTHLLAMVSKHSISYVKGLIDPKFFKPQKTILMTWEERERTQYSIT